MGTGSSAGNEVHKKPGWTTAVQVKPGYLSDRISHFSGGFRRINNNTIELTSSGKYTIDGARWSRGFSSGKHVFECIYPVHLRCPRSRIGLGTRNVALAGDELKDVVGGVQTTWAVEFVSRKTLFGGATVGRFPSRNVLPDRFFMYLDMDAGLLHFGSDNQYFGTAFSNVKATDGPLYPIVTASRLGSIIGIVYRGKGKDISGPLRKTRTLESSTSDKKKRGKKK